MRVSWVDVQNAESNMCFVVDNIHRILKELSSVELNEFLESNSFIAISIKSSSLFNLKTFERDKDFLKTYK